MAECRLLINKSRLCWFLHKRAAECSLNFPSMRCRRTTSSFNTVSGSFKTFSSNRSRAGRRWVRIICKQRRLVRIVWFLMHSSFNKLPIAQLHFTATSASCNTRHYIFYFIQQLLKRKNICLVVRLPGIFPQSLLCCYTFAVHFMLLKNWGHF